MQHARCGKDNHGSRLVNVRAIKCLHDESERLAHVPSLLFFSDRGAMIRKRVYTYTCTRSIVEADRTLMSRYDCCESHVRGYIDTVGAQGILLYVHVSICTRANRLSSEQIDIQPTSQLLLHARSEPIYQMFCAGSTHKPRYYS